jgi:O-antigen ligase
VAYTIQPEIMNKFERLLLGIIILEIPIQVDAYLFFQEHWAEYGAIGGINLSISTFCIGGLYALWLGKFAAAAGYPWRRQLYFGYPAAAYLGCALISLCVAHERSMAINSIVLLAQAFLIYHYLANRVQSRGDVVFAVAMLLVALAMQGMIMLGLFALGHPIQLGPVAGMITEDLRVGGTVGSPVTGATYLALSMAPALAVLATPLASRYKLLAIAALALGGIGLLLTLSRGAWLAVAMSIGVFLFLAWYRRLVSVWLPAALALSLLLIGFTFQESIANRLLGDDEGSAEARLPLVYLAGEMIGDQPLTGVGINNATIVGSQYSALLDYRTEWYYTIHNKYLLEWVELGVFGLAAFVWFLFSTLRYGWTVWQRRDRVLSPLALGLLLAIAGQMLHMTVDVFNSRAQVQSLWLCAGLIVALSRMEYAE